MVFQQTQLLFIKIKAMWKDKLIRWLGDVPKEEHMKSIAISYEHSCLDTYIFVKTLLATHIDSLHGAASVYSKLEAFYNLHRYKLEMLRKEL